MEYKYRLNGTELSLCQNVIMELSNFKQLDKDSLESGGLLMGRTDINGNTKIYETSKPMEKDLRTRFGFRRVDKKHLDVIRKANQRCIYFKGNWHTHPQENPTPSWTDKISWKNAIRKSKPGESRYIYFLIVGTKRFRVWCGNMNTYEIQEMKFQE